MVNSLLYVCYLVIIVVLPLLWKLCGGRIHLFNAFRFTCRKNSPEVDFNRQIPVNCNREKTENGALSQYQDETRQEETSVEVQPYADADGYGEGDGEAPDQDISHSQRHQKVVGGVLQGGVDRDCPAHQDVAGYREKSDDHFNRDVQAIHNDSAECAQGAKPPLLVPEG